MDGVEGKKNRWKVLVSEHVGDEGLQLLREAADVELIERYDLRADELDEILPSLDAILTRSGTAMDAARIERGTRLRVIARAGVGVDNVDLATASKRGIVVINAPTGNTFAATEQTMALMLSVVRRLPQAYRSVRSGEWERKRFTGMQLNGKKALVIGVGRIGTQVALRCRAFGMEVLGYDPYISRKKLESLGVTPVDDLAGAISLADIVTLHVPMTSETCNMIDETMMRAFRRGAYLVNCARGGIVNEKACADALREKRLAGAAFDVYSCEPIAQDNPLLAEDLRDRIILTPHIGANTFEAQSAVAEIAASNMLAALRGQPYEHAVNLPFAEHRLSALQGGYVRLARKMGVIAAKTIAVTAAGSSQNAVLACNVMLRGPLFTEEDDYVGGADRLRPYTVAFLKGLLEVTQGSDVNYMVAPIIARERGIDIAEATGEGRTYRNLVEIVVKTERGDTVIHGTITEEGRPHIVRLNDYPIDFTPRGCLLLFQNHDRPGVIGKIGKLLGDAGVNIANFALGRKDGSGLALAALEIDGDISDVLCGEIAKDADMLWAVTASLNGGL